MTNKKHITIMIKMFAMMKKVIIAVAMLLYSLFSTAQSLRGNMDPSVKPGDDFWQYAEGEAGISVVSALYELNNDRINKLIMAYAEKKNLPQGSDGQKIGALYRLYMDSVSRNKMGYEPIMPYLKQVREVQTREEALKLMYAFDAKGFNTAPFGLSLSLNPFNSSEYMMFARHSGLCRLPQRRFH